MINAKNIHKSFGELEVLKGVDLAVSRGEIVSIVGPSGAGKTTLLQILGTLDKPDSGSVLVDGMDVSKLSSDQMSGFRNKHIGFIFQFHQAVDDFIKRSVSSRTEQQIILVTGLCRDPGGIMGLLRRIDFNGVLV